MGNKIDSNELIIKNPFSSPFLQQLQLFAFSNKFNETVFFPFNFISPGSHWEMNTSFIDFFQWNKLNECTQANVQSPIHYNLIVVTCERLKGSWVIIFQEKSRVIYKNNFVWKAQKGKKRKIERKKESLSIEFKIHVFSLKNNEGRQKIIFFCSFAFFKKEYLILSEVSFRKQNSKWVHELKYQMRFFFKK